MAIGVEQLDIKNIAKIFLLKDQLGSEIASEDFKSYIKSALESFTEEDWDEIRENIFPSSDEKKALRSTIDELKALLAESQVGIRPGQYTEYSVNVLSSAIINAESAIRNQKDESVEDRQLMLMTRALLLNAKDRFLNSVITEDGYLIDNVWYGSKNLLGSNGKIKDGKPVKYDWVPVKIINDTYYVSLEPIHDEYFGKSNLTYIRGLWMIADGKEIIITRDQFPTNLGIEIVEGVIFNGYMYAADEDLVYAPLVSAYLGKPINIAPCRFNGSTNNVGEATSAYLQYTSNFSDIFTNISVEDAQNIFKVIGEGIRVSTLHSMSKSYASAKPNSGIYVDNNNNVITGVGEFTASLGEEIKNLLCFADEADVLVDIEIDDASIEEDPKVVGIIISVQSKNAVTTHTFTLCEDLVLVDNDADNIKGKYYSKYHPVDKSLNWIPTYIIDNKYYISPEPIDENNILYKTNENLIHIVGILDEASGIIYTRYNLEGHELTLNTGKYRLKAVNGGYYNGYWFGANIGDAGQLSNYIKYMQIFRDKEFGDGCEVGFVKSEFKLYQPNSNINSVEKEYFWQGSENDVIKLPDKRSLCKFYLDVIAIRAE